MFLIFHKKFCEFRLKSKFMNAFDEQIEQIEEKLNTTIPYNCSVVEACLALDNKLGATLTYMDWILSMKPGKL
jgi:hypothetical protein